MTRPSVPFDDAAERATVGIVLLNPFALEAAAVLVRADDFYVPAHARLFGVAVELAEEQCGLTAAERVAVGWGRDMRRSEAAERADVPPESVEHLMAEAPVLWGVEPYARRVAATARAREAMAAAAAVYNRLADGADVDDVRPLLSALGG